MQKLLVLTVACIIAGTPLVAAGITASPTIALMASNNLPGLALPGFAESRLGRPEFLNAFAKGAADHFLNRQCARDVTCRGLRLQHCFSKTDR